MPAAAPGNAVRIRFVSDMLDVSDLLAQVKAPTLVLHCKDDATQPFAEGMFIAAGIPGARFVELEGRNHLILDCDPGCPNSARMSVASCARTPDQYYPGLWQENR